MITDLITPVRLLMRWRLVLIAVELLLLLALLRRRAMRVFWTAGYGTGTTAVIRRAVHRSVIHGRSETRVPVLSTTRRDDETLWHVLITGDVLRVAVSLRIRLLANIDTTRTIERHREFQCMLNDRPFRSFW